jgi:hypothetical protein
MRELVLMFVRITAVMEQSNLVVSRPVKFGSHIGLICRQLFEYATGRIPSCSILLVPGSSGPKGFFYLC